MKRFLNNLFCKQTNQKLSVIEKAILYGMPPAKGKLRELQLEIYHLLTFLKKICLENDLIFWMMGGTLLGAKRHQGFIPWDDDMDCSMPRCDLDKLREILKNNDEYEIIDCYNFIPAENFACKMPKLIKKNKLHIFLDIFPYDYIKIENKDENDYWNNFEINRDKLTNELVSLNFENPDCPIKDLSCLSKVDDIISKYIPEVISKDEATHIVRGIENIKPRTCGLYKINEILPNKYLLFEDDIYPVPNDYDLYLRKQFGDIWKLPNDIGELRHFVYSINSREKLNTINER